MHHHPAAPPDPVAALHPGPPDHRRHLIGGIVLAGGAGRRMGGLDKAALVVGGMTLLDRVLAAAQPVCDDVVVVGPPRSAAVRYITETVAGGGPVPAVAAGLAAVDAGCDIVVVLAVDLPLVRADDLRRLVAALDSPGVEAAAADDVGGPNPLLAAYRVAPLQARIAVLGPGARAARLLPAAVATVELGPATLNVNRPEDLAAAEDLLT